MNEDTTDNPPEEEGLQTDTQEINPDVESEETSDPSDISTYDAV